MNKLVKKQLENNVPVDKDNIEKIKTKSFSSGREVKIGDKILYGMVREGETITLTSFHKDEIDTLYIVLEPISNNNFLPEIMKI